VTSYRRTVSTVPVVSGQTTNVTSLALSCVWLWLDSLGDFVPTHTLIKMTAGSDALGFRKEFLLLQLKCDHFVHDQDHAVQRLQRFVHCAVSFEATFHRRFSGLD
jgi:hypothetical protein